MTLFYNKHVKNQFTIAMFIVILNKGIFCKEKNMSNDCIFCKIINGDFNTEFLLENDYLVVFKDINPKAKHHLLVVPKVHVESLNELEDEKLMSELIKGVKEVTKKLGIKSYRVQINTGKEEGQEVFHLHIHVLSKGA